MIVDKPENEQRPSENPLTETEALTQIIGLLNRLDQAARQRLFKTIAAFFQLTTEQSPFFTVEKNISARKEIASFSEDRTMSPKEFLFDKSPQTDVERVVCLAFYLTYYRETPHFKTLDISKLNTEAAQTKLSNPTVAVDNAAKVGFLTQASTKGNKQITAMGELYVRALPDRVAAREAANRVKPRKKSRKIKKPENE